MITTLLNHSLARAVCWYLCLFLVGIQIVTSPASASFISSVPMETENSNDRTIDSLQADLERKLIAERLSMLGISSEEIDNRLEGLSDEECYYIASDLNQSQTEKEENKEKKGASDILLELFLIVFIEIVALALVAPLYR